MDVHINEKYVLAENCRLETKRLLLRPVELADAEDMYEYASDEETTAFVFERHKSLQDTKIAIATYFMDDPLGKFAIVLKENQKMIGTIDIRVNSDAAIGELGYTLNKKYWGKGLMPEAARALLKVGFEQLELVRIRAIHEVQNHKSGRVMKKIGMIEESTIYEAQKIRGRVADVTTYSLSNKAWQQRSKNT